MPRRKRPQPATPTPTPIDPLVSLEPWMLGAILSLLSAERELTVEMWLGRARQQHVTGPGGVRLIAAHLEQLEQRLRELGLPLRYHGVGGHGRGTTPELEITLFEQLERRGLLMRFIEIGNTTIQQCFESAHMSERMAWVLMRCAVARRNADELAAGFAHAGRQARGAALSDWLVGALGMRPSPHWLELLPSAARDLYLARVFDAAIESLLPIDDAVLAHARDTSDKALALVFGRLMILRGEADTVAELGPLPRYGSESLAVLRAFAEGDLELAVAHGAQAIAGMRERKRKFLPGLAGVVHVLANLATSRQQPSRLADAQALIEAANSFDGGWSSVREIHQGLVGHARLGSARAHEYLYGTWQSAWLAALHDVWLGVRPHHQASRGRAVEVLQEMHRAAEAGGYWIVARELAGVANALAGAGEVGGLAGAMRVAAPWEATLAGLEMVSSAMRVSEASASEARRRLVWRLEKLHSFVSIEPRVLGSSGRGKGKRVAIDRLFEDEYQDCVGEADRRVLEALVHDSAMDRTYGQLGPRTIDALIGHPGVVDQDGKALRIERGVAKLQTKRVNGGVRVDVEPAELQRRAQLWTAEGDRLIVHQLTPQLRQVLDVIRAGVEIPEQGVGRLAEVLARLSVAAGVEIEGALEPERTSVDADPRPLLLLDWNGERLRVYLRVGPFGVDGPRCLPGVGHVTMTTERADSSSASDAGSSNKSRLLQTRRDLGRERRLANELVDACPTLASYATATHEFEVPTLIDALDVMLELSAREDTVVLAWPQGRVLRAPAIRDLDELRVSVMGADAWLSVAAQLELDEGQVLGFRELLGQRVGTRYVALGQDRFLALSERLRRRLDALADVGARKDDALRASPAMLPVLDELAADLEHAQFDADSLARLARMRELADTPVRLPRGLRAKLRDYQRDGFAWMWRLAEAGLGACLADDMGLGKTVQTLALLLARARLGPALVVCPTSVVHNWMSEAARFTPSLRTLVLADQSDRAAALASLGPKDVVVCSYGMLVSEADALAKLELATAVFDEAHALKNHGTKRNAAARELQAGFRLGLSGTPIENRVDELWSLFRVLVPGLLGGKQHFDQRFGGPIAVGERAAAMQLRAIMRHFILRRTKAQVLDELPPRTEITVRVEPTAAQQAFYEAVRRRARERVAATEVAKRRFRVLAEITCLRQAAVDPRLLDEAAAPTGAKLDAVLEHLLELREEGHRALVFTQFLGCMALLRARMDAAGVEYIELDGSTPAAERARRVEAFQRGEADVFILSLRAGGVGMNLTGADYVLHVDPWWNPAVEDQATDRAHRIGQTRPVTVYRFVTAGSIEEKILALHEQKRDLADDLLAGLERADGLDLDELIELLDG